MDVHKGLVPCRYILLGSFLFVAMSEFTEFSRVKYPTIVHLVGMGYKYISSNTCVKPLDLYEPYDPLTCILTDKFTEAFLRLNPNLTMEDVASKLSSIQSSLDYDDQGKDFYHKILLNLGEGRIIDLSSEEAFVRNNTFQLATEMRCGDEKGDNFRPDITLFVNGLPLAFFEVKKHNNSKGIEAESDRMKVRFQNRKFRRYLNITQIMCFSNDMNYADNKKMAEARKTTMGHITQEHLQQSRIVVPSSTRLAEKLEELLALIFDKIVVTSEEITLLKQQRDELLPLLMTGQVKIK